MNRFYFNSASGTVWSSATGSSTSGGTTTTVKTGGTASNGGAPVTDGASDSSADPNYSFGNAGTYAYAGPSTVFVTPTANAYP